jgi:16S rRNA C967 or C1407 C5-methylase (RsmB/RsmF family)/NOL1/NOP2/fmu family ribosome biogenesis protein
MPIPQGLQQQLQQLGVDVSALNTAHEQAAHTAIRFNLAKPSNAFSDEALVPWCNHARYLTQKPSFIHDPLWHAGAYYVQEASSMFLQHALQSCIDFTKPLRAIDLCAAPGGKSTLVADLLHEDSLLICNEVIAARVNVLAENTWVSNSDPKQFSNLAHYADLLLIDAPCSGSGLLRKDESYEQEWSEANVQLCAQRQQRIVHDAWPSLKPGGFLVYMTCSFSKQENEDMLDHIFNDLQATTVQVPLNEAWGIVETQSDKHKAFGYRFYPHQLRGEGFFLAVLQKQDCAALGKPLRAQKLSAIKADVQHLVTRNDLVLSTLDGANVLALSPNHIEDYAQLSNSIKLVRKGLLIGSVAKNKIIPTHDMALSIYLNAGFASVEVTSSQALSYFTKSDFRLEGAPKGWLVLRYQGLAIGFVNNLGNRLNNYFPTHLRVRKAAP